MLMDINDEYIKLYKELKKLITSFVKLGYFYDYNEDMFINAFESNKWNKEIIRFSNTIYGSYTGLELFFNKRGLNFLHDSLLCAPEFIRYEEEDSLTLLVLDSSDISYSEGKYIHSMGMKIRKENNLIVYRNNYGKKTNFANYKELDNLLKHLYFINQILEDEFEPINENLYKQNYPLSLINDELMKYSINYFPLPNLETLPKLEKPNLDLINENKNRIYNPNESFMLASYYPLICKENNIKPLLISFLSPNDKIIFKYIITPINQYKKVLFGLMDEIFENLEFLPSKILFDNRDLHQILAKTLDGLNIEHELIRNITPFDVTSYVDKSIELDYKKNIGLESNIQPKAVIESFLDFITKTISEIDFKSLNLSDAIDELEELEDYNDDSDDENNDDTNLVA